MDYLSNKREAPSRATDFVGGAGLGMQAQITNPIERKPSNMEQAIKELSGVHARIDALIGELERKISPVLLAAAPSTQAEQGNGGVSPLAGKLFEESAMARMLAERLDSIVSRVDL